MKHILALVVFVCLCSALFLFPYVCSVHQHNIVITYMDELDGETLWLWLLTDRFSQLEINEKYNERCKLFFMVKHTLTYAQT